MTKTRRILIVTTVLAAAAYSEAGAQTSPAPASRGFINFNVGAQPSSRSIAKSEIRSVYGETATISSSQKIGNGSMLDFTAGYRVWHGLAVAVGFSSFSNVSDSAVVASIPHPLFFDRPATVNATQADLTHSEKGVHLQAVYFIPVTDKIDVSLAIGPSFIAVTQQLVSSVTIPAATQTVSLTVGSEEETAKGVNIGFDGNYLFTRNVGAGIFMRYAGGTVDLPSAPGLKVGGLQVGVGARIRF